MHGGLDGLDLSKVNPIYYQKAVFKSEEKAGLSEGTGATARDSIPSRFGDNVFGAVRTNNKEKAISYCNALADQLKKEISITGEEINTPFRNTDGYTICQFSDGSIFR